MVNLEKMLIGRHIVKLGEKNRIAFPRKMRTVLGDSLILSLGFENSIMVFGKDKWNEATQEIESHTMLIKEARELKRHIIGSATEVECDAQGRFVLPSYLKEFAHITNEVVIIGLGKYAEIWDKAKWEDEQLKSAKNIEETARALAGRINE